MSHDDMITIHADILQITDAAVLIDCSGIETWLPLSQVELEGGAEPGDTGIPIDLPEWLANNNGLFDGAGMHLTSIKELHPATLKLEASQKREEPDHICDTCAHVDGFLCYSQLEDSSCPELCNKCCHLFDDPADTEDYQDHWSAQPLEFEATENLGMGKDSEFAESASRPTDIHLLGHDTITVDIALSKEELNAVASRMADAISRKERLESELDSFRKDINKQIKDAEHDASLAALDYRLGKVKRTVDCEKLADYGLCQIIWRSKDSEEIVQRRPMTAEEKQFPLPISYPDATPSIMLVGESFGGPMEKAHTCIDCACLADRADAAELPEPCQTCVQAANGDIDNWSARRECRTCEHASCDVAMPPCSHCALNADEGHRGDEDRWEWREAADSAGDNALTEAESSFITPADSSNTDASVTV